MAKRTTTTNREEEHARPLGDTGRGDGGDVRQDEQGISNREGDRDQDADDLRGDEDDTAGQP